MAKAFKLKVLNPAEALLEVHEAAWMHVRLVDGTGLTIYPGHAPLLAETVTAPLRYADDTGEHVFNAEAGILQVDGDQVTILTSGEWEAEAAPKASAVSEERRFERLAQELHDKLDEEADSTLGSVLSIGRG
ncbi:MAG: hypothetical protein KGY78_02255 [Anaerolineae bacterium]|nr:hypothetical protein [Anaerolineae bacterium]